VLFSIDEYERISLFLEYMESLEEKEVAKVLALLPAEGKRKSYSIEHLKKDIN